MTPNLIVESNRMLPYNLINWDIAYEKYADLVKSFKTAGIFFYFKLKTDKTGYSRWFDNQVSGDTRFPILLKLLKKHRFFYEGIEVESCPGTPQLDFYSESCLEHNDELKKILTDFWTQEVLPQLRASSFNEFWEAKKSESPSAFEGSKRFAYEIFSNFVSFPELLGLLQSNDDN